MKNKRNVLIAFILICCLCLSIGYAALTDTLYVSGTASVNVVSGVGDGGDTEFEKKFVAEVYWASASGDTGVTCETVAEGSTKASDIGTADTTDSDAKPDVLLITIDDTVLTSEGDSTIINATVQNGSEYAINAALTDWADDNEYLDVTWTIADGGNIAQGGTGEVTITVTLAKAPTTDASYTFSMSLKAQATD